MSLDDHLIHTCTIENPASGGMNPYGNEVKGYATPVTGVRCRLIEDREFVREGELEQGLIQSVYKLMVRASVTLQERAKVSLVTLEDGSSVSDVFEVREVLIRRGRNSHHKTAVLERIS